MVILLAAGRSGLRRVDDYICDFPFSRLTSLHVDALFDGYNARATAKTKLARIVSATQAELQYRDTGRSNAF